jgi:hypothetical protein
MNENKERARITASKQRISLVRGSLSLSKGFCSDQAVVGAVSGPGTLKSRFLLVV